MEMLSKGEGGGTEGGGGRGGGGGGGGGGRGGGFLVLSLSIRACKRVCRMKRVATCAC